MKINDLLNESHPFVAEMANFLADTTDLPANIVLWTKTQPEELPHTKYRMKVFKDRIHCATFTVGTVPAELWQTSSKKHQLDSYEWQEAVSVISSYSSLFIGYIDGKSDSDTIKQEIKKLRGQQ